MGEGRGALGQAPGGVVAMSWVRLDDGLPDNPKLIGLSDRAFRVYIHGLCYCARNQTDGVVPAGATRSLGALPRHVAELIAAGRWEEHGDDWRIHDYLKYNPSREQDEERKRNRAAAGRLGGLAKSRSNSSG